MKMLSNFGSRLLLVSVLAIFASGCSDGVRFSSGQALKFSGDDDSPPPIDDIVRPPVDTPPDVEPPIVVTPPPPIDVPPVDEPPIVVTPPTPAPLPLTQWTSTCPGGPNGSGQLTSCMSCPPPAPAEPDLSGKAKRLLDTMDRACRIPNKSAPLGYIPPTREELIRRLRACSPQIYPDTILTSAEKKVIPALAEGDPSLLDKMFSGLWYQPPHSDAFDHYFGLGVEEAVPLFCHKTKTHLTGELWSREMWDWSYRDALEYWPKDLRELHAYYQQVRSGLVACLDQNGEGGPSGPITTPNPGGSQPACTVKGYSGDNFTELKERVTQLLNEGFTVSLESDVACLMVTDRNLAPTTGYVTLVGMNCH